MYMKEKWLNKSTVKKLEFLGNNSYLMFPLLDFQIHQDLKFCLQSRP